VSKPANGINTFKDCPMTTAQIPNPSMPEQKLREIFRADVAVLRQRAAREAASVLVPTDVRHSRDLKRAEMNRSTSTNRATEKLHITQTVPPVASPGGHHDPTSRLRKNAHREKRISRATASSD